MDIRKIIGIILAVALAAVLFILIRSDKGSATEPKPKETPAAAETEPTEQEPHYHVAVLSNSELEHYPLVRIDLEGMDIPVYACTDSEGEVRFFVYGFEETTAQYGFLPAYPSYPEVRIDNSNGFAELPRLAKGWTDGESGYPEIALASVNGEAAQFYYPSDGNGNMRDGAIPVVLEENNHIFGAYYVFDEAHKALICPLDGAPATIEPEETATPEPSASPLTSATPTASATASATPKPTNRPNRSPRPTAKPSATASAQPSASSTAQASASATPQPSTTATLQPTSTPSAQPTATLEPEGEWKYVYVIDQPEVKHQEWHCHVCGKVFLDKDSCMADQNKHKTDPNDPYYGTSGWHVEWVVDQEEVGHWEWMFFPNP